MNEFEDIKKQLEVKNKEIYMNKLNLDLDNNLEVLLLTIDNLLSYTKEESIKKILEIEEGFINKKEIEEKINHFINLYHDNLINFLANKKSNLQNFIIIHDDLAICKDNLNNNYLDLKENLISFSKDNINNLEINLKEIIKGEFKLKRLTEYLNNIFIVNLNNRVLDTIKNRDLVLLNTFNETYLKYLELNKNTVGV